MFLFTLNNKFMPDFLLVLVIGVGERRFIITVYFPLFLILLLS